MRVRGLGEGPIYFEFRRDMDYSGQKAFSEQLPVPKRPTSLYPNPYIPLITANGTPTIGDRILPLPLDLSYSGLAEAWGGLLS